MKEKVKRDLSELQVESFTKYISRKKFLETNGEFDPHKTHGGKIQRRLFVLVSSFDHTNIVSTIFQVSKISTKEALIC